MALHGFRMRVAWFYLGRDDHCQVFCLRCTAVQLPASDTLLVGHGACDQHRRDGALCRTSHHQCQRVHNFPTQRSQAYSTCQPTSLPLAEQPACRLPAFTASQPPALSQLIAEPSSALQCKASQPPAMLRAKPAACLTKKINTATTSELAVG